MDTHCTTLGGVLPGPAAPARLGNGVLSPGAFAIVWALIWVTDHIPFSLWLPGSSGSAASVHPSPFYSKHTNPIPVLLTHSLFAPL